VYFINEERKLVSHTISVRILVDKHDNESLKEALMESFIKWDIIEVKAITADNPDKKNGVLNSLKRMSNACQTGWQRIWHAF
jgi:hypothetical protein